MIPKRQSAIPAVYLARKQTTWLLVALLCACSGCERGNKMAPLPPHFSIGAPDRVPVILVGRLLENSHAVAGPVTSEWNREPMQLWEAKVRVEQVLQGEVKRSEVDIYYFIDGGMAGPGSDSRVITLHSGHSEIFFLQRDSDRLRTICDGWRSCIIWVGTGSHYHFKAEPGKPIQDVIVDLLLSRGGYTSDQQMIDAIYHPEWRWGTLPVYNALQRVAEKDTSAAVREIALQRLRHLGTCCGPLNRATPSNW